MDSEQLTMASTRRLLANGADWSLITGLRNRFGDRFGLRYFVETGTAGGNNILNAAELFKHVWSIEQDNDLHSIASQRCQNLKNVTLILGDSSKGLPSICDQLDNHTLFYLDAHWDGEAPTELPQCPILQELEVIGRRWPEYQDVIIIDDARMFLHPPQPPYDHKQWPSTSSILSLMRENHPPLCAQLVVNQIVLTPERIVQEW